MRWARDRSTVATVAELLSSILRDPPAPWPPSLSNPLPEIGQKCLAKDPAERYQRAADVRLVLEAVASGLRLVTPPSDPRVSTGRLSHRLLCSA